MPVIAYQSFNANSSTTHGLKALANQPFTRDTNAYVTGKGDSALILPFITGHISAPVEGPAELRPIQRLTSPQTVGVFGSHISLLWQNVYRALGAMPDILMCGELDASHNDFVNVVSGPDIALRPVPASRACQSFTAVSQTSLASRIEFVSSGDGYVVYKVRGLTVVFVHVPNRIATSQSEATNFYAAIAKSLQQSGSLIHLVLGDTNQPNLTFTAAALNTAFSTSVYENALTAANLEKIDNYNVTERGTNSTGRKMYDVAVFRSDLVELKSPVKYISQSAGGVTVTDHCGLAVKVELK